LHRLNRDPAKLRADAQKVVSIISADKAKSEIESLGPQFERAAQEKDEKEVEALTRKQVNWKNNWVPNTAKLLGGLNEANPNSKDAQEIESMFDNLGDTCPH
jgi:hypothetical protein